MSLPPSLADGEGDLDLRAVAQSVRRRVGIVIGCTIVAMLIAAIVNHFIIPPTYQATIVVNLPQRNNTNSAEVNAGIPVREVYDAIAFNTGVLSSVKAEMSLNESLGELRSRYTSRSRGQILEVTARGRSAAEAYNLVQAWLTGFKGETIRYARSTYEPRMAALEAELAAQRAEFERAQEEILMMQSDASLDLLKAQVEGLRREIVQVQTRQQYLSLVEIPKDEARQSLLTERRAEMVEAVSVDQSSEGQGESDPTSVLLRELLVTEAGIASKDAELAGLAGLLDVLRADLTDLQSQVLSEQTQYTRAMDEYTEAQKTYESIRAELNQLQSAYRRIDSRVIPEVIVAPEMPGSPVAPKTRRNVALTGFLVAVIGFGLALFEGALRRDPPVSA